jgi:heme-degrading monooxygenase HmoA
MIARTWTARAALTNPDGYPRHFRDVVLPTARKLDGFVDATLFRRKTAAGFEFLVVSRWASIDAVRAFAGDDVIRARIEPDAIATLIAYDKTVRIYEVMEA